MRKIMFFSPVEPEHTGVDVNVWDLRKNNLKRSHTVFQIFVNLSYKSKHLDQSLQAKEYVEHGCWQWWVPLLLWLVVLLLVVQVVLLLVVQVVLLLVVLVVLLLVVLVVLLLLDLSSPPSPSHLNRVSCSSVCSPPCKTWVQQGCGVKLGQKGLKLAFLDQK